MTLWALMLRRVLRRCGSHWFGKRFGFVASCDGSLGNRRRLLFQSRLASERGRKSHRNYKSNLEKRILMSCSSTNRRRIGGKLGAGGGRKERWLRWDGHVCSICCGTENVPSKPWDNCGAIRFLCQFQSNTRQSIFLLAELTSKPPLIRHKLHYYH